MELRDKLLSPEFWKEERRTTLKEWRSNGQPLIGNPPPDKADPNKTVASFGCREQVGIAPMYAAAHGVGAAGQKVRLNGRCCTLVIQGLDQPCSEFSN